MAGSSHDYSTLELDTSRSATARSPHDQEGLQVAQDHGKVYVPSSSPTYNYSQDPEPLVNKDFSHAQHTAPPVQRPWWKKKRFFVTAIVLLVLIAIGLGVGLGVALSSSDDSSGDISPPTDPESASAALMRRNIAAASVQDGSTNRTWVFYQSNDGKIMRSGATSLNGPFTTDETGASAKNHSALAAAVSRPGLPLQISVFYVDNNDILHDVNFSEGTGRWEPGTLANEEYKAMPNSSIAALYNHCRRCTNNTIIAYQDVNGFVQIGNLTSQGWSDANGQLGSNLRPASGTGLAFQPFYRANTSDQINLYYQRSELRNLTLAAFQEELPNNDNPGWRVAAQAYTPIPFGSPIAAGSAYSNVTNGLESWIQVLTLSNSGVKVNSWAGTKNDWTELFASPSTFANSTVNPKLYGNLAMTANGGAFVVTQEADKTPSIENWQLRDDFISWDQVGAIDAW